MTATSTTNPFVGLRPFESNEDLLFFGRDEQVLSILQRLHSHHFVAVIGSSGSGKSSLIKAGLIPALEAGYLVNDRDRWQIASMKPGQNPLYHLAEALVQMGEGTDSTGATDLVQKIKEEGADAVLNLLAAPLQAGANIFLLVDQFEELFRFCLDAKDAVAREDATDFVNILLELASQKERPVYVVVTMRSDFIGDCTQFFGLPEALNESQYLVPRLNRSQLKTTIEGPARLSGRRVSPALTARLLNDTQTVRDELPLLQHALMRTWAYEAEKDRNGELDIRDYESIGGLEKALSNHADEAFAAMPEGEQAIAKKLFQALTAVDENGRKVRKPATLGELEALTGASQEKLLQIIQRFIEGNRSFLVVNRTGEKKDWLIDISHESLIRQWNALSAWVDEEAESVKIYSRLSESALLYGTKKKDLLAGSELQLALQWYNETRPTAVWASRYNPEFERSVQYLQDSRHFEEAWMRRQRLRKRNQRLFFALLALAVIGSLLGYSRQQASAALTAESLRKRAQDAAKEAAVQRDSARHALIMAQKANVQAQKNAERASVADSFTRLALKNLREKTARLIRSEMVARDNAVIATAAQKKTAVQKDAFRLILEARQKAIDDPTEALRTAMQAVRKFCRPADCKRSQPTLRQQCLLQDVGNRFATVYGGPLY